MSGGKLTIDISMAVLNGLKPSTPKNRNTMMLSAKETLAHVLLVTINPIANGAKAGVKNVIVLDLGIHIPKAHLGLHMAELAMLKHSIVDLMMSIILLELLVLTLVELIDVSVDETNVKTKDKSDIRVKLMDV